MKTIYLLLCLLLCQSVSSQTRINGLITDPSGLSIIGANVFIEGSYDGSITDVEGRFSFETSTIGKQTLCISYLGYETKNISDEVDNLTNLQIKLRPSAKVMDAVQISGSTFKAGDNSSLAVLKPMDIVTTAGSMGDVIASFQTLPGTQSNSEDGRLFVRGGDADETLIFIDGMRVFAPYTNSIGGSPSRGRFSPFLFKGMSFSTGGYDASYGQALSGVLDMQTADEVNQTETNVNLMTVGLGIGHKQAFGKSSITANLSYIDLGPYTWIAPNRINQTRPYHGFSGEAVFTHKTNKGLFKSYLSAEKGRIAFEQRDINSEVPNALDLLNTNAYLSSSYNHYFNDKTSLFAGISIGQNGEEIQLDSAQIAQGLDGLHAKIKATHFFNDHFKIGLGAEHIFLSNDLSKAIGNNELVFNGTANRNISALFAESAYFFTANLALKLGLRTEYHSLFGSMSIKPRMTLAQKINKKQQISFSFGQYTQEVGEEYLFGTEELTNQRANHFLLNYQYNSKKHIVRLEGFYKKYNFLISFKQSALASENVGNKGFGDAYGMDVFYRANRVIKNTDCWISYSWLQSERKYKDYPSLATPNYATTHNLSLVAKTWIQALSSQLSVTYSVASGRPYENPNKPGFMNDLSKPYQNLSLSWAYLITPQKILFVSVSNATGVKNEFGYRYANVVNGEGIYPGEIIRPNEDRFFFAGFFMTIGRNKKSNQLQNL